MINNNMCSKFATNYNTINNSLNTLNYPMSSNIASATDYKTNQTCWIRQMNTRFLNNPAMHDYIRTKRDNNHYLPPFLSGWQRHPAKREQKDQKLCFAAVASPGVTSQLQTVQFQPYGTFMDFSKPVYQDARICDLKYTPSAGFKKINNQDLFILKNEKHNNAVIKSALDDFIFIDKQN